MQSNGLLRAFEIASGDIGVSEWPVGNNPLIVKYHSVTDYASKSQDESWCASFVCWALDAARLVHTKSPRARSYSNYGSARQGEWQTGDIIVLSRGTNPYNGHVGFYVKTPDQILASGWVLILGGNQDNKVCVKAYPLSRVIAVRTIIDDNDTDLILSDIEQVTWSEQEVV